jgi:pimeloyl-ACP methyl ester carboxylesterase
VKADSAAAEKIPVLDRLLTPEFRAQHPDLAFLFQQMGTFNTAKMADLRNLGSDGPTITELNAAPFPVLLLAAENDRVLSPSTVRRAGELLAHAQVEVVPGAPHSMYWETPALFNDAVGRFSHASRRPRPRTREVWSRRGSARYRHLMPRDVLRICCDTDCDRIRPADPLKVR